MLPLTAACPKPLLPLAGRPVLEYLLALCRRHGITEVAINLHHCPEAIPARFGDGRDLGMRLRYFYEERLLGSAGALGPMRPFLDRTFFVLYGDVLTDADLGALLAHHRRKGGLGTLVLYRVPDPQRCGLVDLDEVGRIRRFVEKPPSEQVFTNLVNAGIYLLEPEVLAYLPAKTPCDFGQDLFPLLLQAGVPLYGYSLEPGRYLLDIGTPENYARAQREWPAIGAGLLSPRP